MQEGCGRGAGGVQEGCRRGVGGVQEGCRRGVGGVWEGCRRGAGGVQEGCGRHTFIFSTKRISANYNLEAAVSILHLLLKQQLQHHFPIKPYPTAFRPVPQGQLMRTCSLTLLPLRCQDQLMFSTERLSANNLEAGMFIPCLLIDHPQHPSPFTPPPLPLPDFPSAPRSGPADAHHSVLHRAPQCQQPRGGCLHPLPAHVCSGSGKPCAAAWTAGEMRGGGVMFAVAAASHVLLHGLQVR